MLSFKPMLIVVTALVNLQKRALVSAHDVNVIEDDLKCIPKEVQGITRISSQSGYSLQTYFLPLVSGYYIFNITEIVQRNNAFGDKFYYQRSDGDGERNGSKFEVGTQINRKRFTAWKTSGTLVSGSLYLLRFTHDTSVIIESMEYKYLIFTNYSTLKRMDNQIIKFSEISMLKSRSLLGDWGTWSSCSHTCGNGTKTRQRFCSHGDLELMGKMDVSLISNETTLCQKNVSCTGVAYYIGQEETTCHDKCKQEGRICAQHGHDFPPTDAIALFAALGINCTTIKLENFLKDKLPLYANPNAPECRQFKNIKENVVNCGLKVDYRICPCGPKPVPPIIEEKIRVSRNRLDIALRKPETPRIQYYTTFTLMAFYLNGSLAASTTIDKEYYWAVHNGYQPLTNYCFKAYTTSLNGVGDNTSCVYFDTRDVPSQAPTNLTAHIVNGSMLSASWNPINMSYPVMYGMPFKKYTLFAYQYGTNKHVHTEIRSFQSTSVYIENVLYYTKYCIKVAVSNSIGRGPLTDGCLVNVTTQGGAPQSFPKVDSIRHIENVSFEVSWQMPQTEILGDNETECLIYINNSHNALKPFKSYKFNSLNSKWKFADLQPLTLYYFKIWCVNQYGKGPSSDWYNVTTQEGAPGWYPQSLTYHELNKTAVNISWGLVPERSRHGTILGYTLCTWNSSASLCDKLVWIYNETQSIIITVDIGVVYCFKVAAFNSVGLGPRSGCVDVKTISSPTAPPSNITVITTNETSIRIQWGNVPEEHRHGSITSYEILITHGELSNVNYIYYISNHHLDVNNLQVYTLYYIIVRAINRVGPGITSLKISVRTDESVPSIAPTEFKVVGKGPRRIGLSWTEIPDKKINGVLLGYHFYVKKCGSSEEDIWTYNTSSQITAITFIGLPVMTCYNVSAALFTRKGSGIRSEWANGSTFESVPSAPPENIVAYNTSSTSINITWGHVQEEYRNGIIIGYVVVLLNGFSNVTISTTVMDASTKHLHVFNLQKYTPHCVQVLAFTRVGNGSLSSCLKVSTDEDVPSWPPSSVTLNIMSPRTIAVAWQPIPIEYRNGIITEYNIKVQDCNTPNTSKDVRIVHDEARMSADVVSKPYTCYKLSLCGVTVRGQGIYSDWYTITTSQDKPSNTPQNIITGTNSSSSLFVMWKEVPKMDQNGIILGYRVKATDEHNTVANATISSMTYRFANLEKFTIYCVQVLAFTSAGDGNWSSCVNQKTMQDIPEEAPTNVTGKPLDSSAFQVSWQKPDSKNLNGLLRGFCITVHRFRYSGGMVPNPVRIALTSPESTSRVFADLYKGTKYCVVISAFTDVGQGKKSNCTNVTTNEDIPSSPPRSIEVIPTSPTSLLVSWKNIIWNERNGVLLSFTLVLSLIRSSTLKPSESIEATTTSVTTTYTSTLTALPLAASAARTADSLSTTTTLSTMLTSSSLLTTSLLSMTTSSSPMTTPSSPMTTSLSSMMTSSSSMITSSSPMTTSLSPMTTYSSPMTTSSSPMTTSSSSMTTSSSPMISPVTTLLRSENSIIPPSRTRRDLDSNILFLPIRMPSHKVAHLRGNENNRRHKRSYHVEVQEDNNNIKQRHRRSVESDIVINVEPGTRSYEVKNLEKGVEYCVIMYGTNAIGSGAKSNCAYQKTPLKYDIMPTVNLQASDTTIVVSLNITDFENLRNSRYLQYYNLEFTELRVSGNPVLNQNVIKEVVKASTQRFTIDRFSTYTTYALQVSVVTRSGSGSFSAPVYVETCRCPSNLYTNWFISPPFSDLESPSQVGGILPIILEHIIDIACGRCDLSHGKSKLDYFIDISGKSASLKQNMSLASMAVDQNSDISFPFNSKSEVNYKGTYIPILHVPALLLIKRNESSFNKYAMVVAGSILDIWPIIVINISLMLLAGAIIWTIERMSNTEQFPVKTAQGLFEGAWWSLITMTTIGYGDRYPVTFLGRIFAIIWALIGISMSSIMIGAISSTLTVTIVQEITTGVARGVTIGAVANTPDYIVAKDVSNKAGALLRAFPNIEDLVLALRHEEIDSIVLDHFTVKWKKNLFNGTWFKYSDAVGLAFSYGVLLNGNASKLHRHFREYIAANISRIMQIAGGLDNIVINNNQTTGEKETSESIVFKEELSLDLLRPDSTIFVNTMMAMGLVFLGVFLIGLFYQIISNSKRNRANEILKDEYRQYIELTESRLQEFYSKFCSMNTEFRQTLTESLKLAKRKANEKTARSAR